METERLDLLTSFWPVCIGFVLSLLALLALMVATSTATQNYNLRGTIPAERSVILDEGYPAYISQTLG